MTRSGGYKPGVQGNRRQRWSNIRPVALIWRSWQMRSSSLPSVLAISKRRRSGLFFTESLDSEVKLEQHLSSGWIFSNDPRP